MILDRDNSYATADDNREEEIGLLHEDLDEEWDFERGKAPHRNYKYTETSVTGYERQNVVTKTYKSRFWILFLAAFLCWIHTLQWSTWGPISESMNAAFPGWGPSTVALMVNWGTIMYVLCVAPLCWGMQRYGLRAGVVTSAAFMAIGTGLRCLTKQTPTFTILCHICAILVGGASALALTTPMVIANDWFPQNERTTATAIILGISQLGSLGSFLEPTFIRLPGPGVTKEDIQDDVMNLVYAGAIMSAVLLLALLVYYPSKPPKPPSLSSTTERVEFIPGLASVIRNKKLLLIVAIYGTFVGPPVAWITVLNFSVLPLGFHQGKAMWMGVTAVLVSSLSPVAAGRINDLLQGHIKTLIVTLMLGTTAFCYWFLLISYGVVEVTEWQVYVSTVGICACNYAAMPLFFEVAVDIAFPISDILVMGVMTAADCLVSTLFLTAYSIPNAGYLWIPSTMIFTSGIGIIPMLLLKFNNTRALIDNQIRVDSPYHK
ncbi:Disrupted in renal carcinoma protein 2 [Portunus trituberculatus]|uniref:Disrupted in renal carcinoma protein 2 n=1 Tax=Portunus trituberculatus TaxID=210409 RepID=A0A5B7CYK0_PORTR|nr:Disrupted in renal carcinoma protein 2 [Portunus trituberculatus]